MKNTTNRQAVKTSNVYAIVAFFLLVIVTWGGLSAALSVNRRYVPKTDGVFDLRDFNFENSVQVIEAEGWDSWPLKLHTPEDFRQGIPAEPILAQISDYESTDYFTHRITLLLNPGKTYGISMVSPGYAMRIFIGGREAGNVGNPASSKEEMIAGMSEVTYFFTPQTDRVDVIVQTSNFVHGRLGCRISAVSIGYAENINTLDKRVGFFNALIIGCLLTSFLYHLSLYLLTSWRVSTLLFAFSCLLLAMTDGRLVYVFFPDISWYADKRIEYLVHYLICVSVLLFLSKQFPKLLHKKVVLPFYTLLILHVITLVLGTRLFTAAATYFSFVVIALITYITARFIMSIRLGKTYVLGFIGMLVFGLFSINDLLHYRELGTFISFAGQAFTTPVGMVFFVFCYSLLIAIEYAETQRAMIEAQETTVALERIDHLKTDLMTTISHEARTPLAVLSSYASLVALELRDKGIEEQASENLDQVVYEAKRVAELIDSLKIAALSNERIAKRISADIGDIAKQTTRLYRHMLEAQGVEFEVIIEKDLPPVCGCPEELTQVLFNLLLNAHQHTEQGKVLLTVKSENNQILTTITDTGTGISAKILPKIFERGVTGRNGGNGIGLAVCKDIISAHNGTIKIESEIGMGTTVIVTLPIQERRKKDGA